MRISMVGMYGVVVGLVAAAMGCADSPPFAPVYSPVDPEAEPVGNAEPDDSGEGDDSPRGDFLELANGLSVGGGENAPHLLEVTGVTPVRLTGDGDEVPLDPHEASMTLTLVHWDLDGESFSHTPLEGSDITVPFTVGAVGFGFGQQLQLTLRLDASEYDVQCDLVFDPGGHVSGATRVDEGAGFEFGDLLCPDELNGFGLVINFRVEEDPRPPNPDVEAEFVCDGAPLPVGGKTAVGSISCPSFDTDGSPTFDVRVWAAPLGPIGAETEFNVQAQLIHPEPIVSAYRDFLGVAVLSEAYIELARLDGTNAIAVPVSGPCELDYTNAGGAPGPVTMTTRVETARWPATNGSVTVEATR